MLDRATEALLKALEPATSRELRDYLDAIRRDQGAVIQLTPEAMDLFQAGIEDRDGVTYQCTCAQAPPPTPGSLAGSLATISPWRVISSTLFTTMYGLTARYDDIYPCAAPAIPVEIERTFESVWGKVPGARANDGVVPTLSQIWGKVAWAGYADHLDVLGHFPGKSSPGPFWSKWLGRGSASVSPGDVAVAKGGVAPPRAADEVHVDWLRSGASFDERAFDALVDAIAKGMLSSTA